MKHEEASKILKEVYGLYIPNSDQNYLFLSTWALLGGRRSADVIEVERSEDYLRMTCDYFSLSVDDKIKGLKIMREVYRNFGKN